MRVVDEYEGILPAYKAFYAQSIAYAAERAEAAFQRFEEIDAGADSAAQVFAALQEALTHAGALSRFFWPVRERSRLANARGKRLREAFELSDNSPLRSRELRNAFEHFDEDLDRFLLKDLGEYFFPDPILGSHQLADEATGNIFKLIDMKYGVCVLLGKKFEFRPIRREVQHILSQTLQSDKNGSRL